MKNFLAGVLLGSTAMYLYLTTGSEVREMVHELWARASSAPVATPARRAP
jgi:hypothetical protein